MRNDKHAQAAFDRNSNGNRDGILAPGTTVGQGQSGTHALTCGPDKTIGQAIKTLKPGDTLLVSGTCNENVTIGQEVERITLDGQGTPRSG